MQDEPWTGDQKTLIRLHTLPLPKYVTLGKSHKHSEPCFPIYQIRIIILTSQVCYKAAMRYCTWKHFRSNKNIL